jgi:hypothetical protein
MEPQTAIEAANAALSKIIADAAKEKDENDQPKKPASLTWGRAWTSAYRAENENELPSEADLQQAHHDLYGRKMQVGTVAKVFGRLTSAEAREMSDKLSALAEYLDLDQDKPAAAAKSTQKKVEDMTLAEANSESKRLMARLTKVQTRIMDLMTASQGE